MSKPYIIRDYRPSDYRGVLGLWQLTGLGGAHRGDNEKTIDLSLSIGGKLLVVEDAATTIIVGTSWMTFDGRRIHLHHFGVKPELQHTGIGTDLAIASLKFAKEKKIQIKLEVHKDNQKAINLYKKLGFEYLGDYDVYIIRDVENVKL